MEICLQLNKKRANRGNAIIVVVTTRKNEEDTVIKHTQIKSTQTASCYAQMGDTPII